jgi:hypothetical protein
MFFFFFFFVASEKKETRRRLVRTIYSVLLPCYFSECSLIPITSQKMESGRHITYNMEAVFQASINYNFLSLESDI